MDFSEYIKSLRKEKKLRLVDLEKLSGVSKTHISRLEREKNKLPKPETLKKLAPALGVTYEHLMYAAGLYQDTPEEEFISNIDLSDEALFKKFNFSLDGRPLSEEEAKNIIAFLRVARSMNKR